MFDISLPERNDIMNDVLGTRLRQLGFTPCGANLTQWYRVCGTEVIQILILTRYMHPIRYSLFMGSQPLYRNVFLPNCKNPKGSLSESEKEKLIMARFHDVSHVFHKFQLHRPVRFEGINEDISNYDGLIYTPYSDTRKLVYERWPVLWDEVILPFMNRTQTILGTYTENRTIYLLKYRKETLEPKELGLGCVEILDAMFLQEKGPDWDAIREDLNQRWNNANRETEIAALKTNAPIFSILQAYFNGNNDEVFRLYQKRCTASMKRIQRYISAFSDRK